MANDTILPSNSTEEIVLGDAGTEIDLTNISTINIDDIISTSLPASSLNYSFTNMNSGMISSAPTYTFNTAGYSGITTSNPSLNVRGDAEFEGDIKWKGRSLGNMLENIEKRLAILVPDPEKLEHFEALKKAYEHYKTLEALCEIPKEEKE